MSEAGADAQYLQLKDLARQIFSLTREIDVLETRLTTRKAARQALVDQCGPIVAAIEAELQLSELM